MPLAVPLSITRWGEIHMISKQWLQFLKRLAPLLVSVAMSATAVCKLIRIAACDFCSGVSTAVCNTQLPLISAAVDAAVCFHSDFATTSGGWTLLLSTLSLLMGQSCCRLHLCWWANPVPHRSCFCWWTNPVVHSACFDGSISVVHSRIC